MVEPTQIPTIYELTDSQTYSEDEYNRKNIEINLEQCETKEENPQNTLFLKKSKKLNYGKCQFEPKDSINLLLFNVKKKFEQYCSKEIKQVAKNLQVNKTFVQNLIGFNTQRLGGQQNQDKSKLLNWVQRLKKSNKKDQKSIKQIKKKRKKVRKLLQKGMSIEPRCQTRRTSLSQENIVNSIVNELKKMI